MEKETKKKSRKKLYVLLGAGAGLLGLTAFGIWWFKRHQGDQMENENDLLFKLANKKHIDSSNVSTEERSSKGGVNENKNFPLRKGSKGELVKKLQDALVEKFGADIFSTKKATGYFGDETAGILKDKGFPAVIDEAAFKKIVASGSAPEANNETEENIPGESPKPEAPVPTSPGLRPFLTTKQAIDVAKNIWLNATLRKLTPMIATLKRMKNVADYSKVNKLFSTIRTRGIHQTIVNAALSAFTDDTSHQMMVQEFERMGLKYDGEKWSLSGVQNKQLITSRATTVTSLEGIGLDVPENTLLGEAVSKVGQLTTFRTIDNKILYVPTKHVSHV